MTGAGQGADNDAYETPAYTVDEIRTHDAEYVRPLPRRTNYGVNGFAVQGRRDMIHHYEALLREVEGLKAALLRIRAECAAPVSADAQREAVHSAYNIATAALSPASGGV